MLPSKEAARGFCTPENSHLRDWSLDPQPLLDGQDMYRAATVEAWGHREKVLKWLDPSDEPIPTHAGIFIMNTRSDWLS